MCESIGARHIFKRINRLTGSFERGARFIIYLDAYRLAKLAQNSRLKLATKERKPAVFRPLVKAFVMFKTLLIVRLELNI